MKKYRRSYSTIIIISPNILNEKVQSKFDRIRFLEQSKSEFIQKIESIGYKVSFGASSEIINEDELTEI